VTRWRLAVAVLLLLGFALPLVMPFVELAGQPDAWQVWSDRSRLLDLARNTAFLVGGTVAGAVPIGVAGAILLYRTDLPGRHLLRFLTLLTLFVPLPLFASAWQGALGTGGLLQFDAWTAPPEPAPAPDGPSSSGIPYKPDSVSSGGIAWKPWAQGLGAAIWVHAVAGLPWVVWIVGQGLRRVERELEEEALLAAGPWRVLWAVTLPRCRAAIFAAALWVALQTATEITVTDMMQVRTYAEEVYNQFVFGRPALAGAVVVSLPAVLATAAVVLAAARRWEQSLPPLETTGEPLCLFALRHWAIPWSVVAFAGFGLLLGVPLAGLVWRAGLSGSPEAWSMHEVWVNVARVPAAHGRLLVDSLVVAVVAGVLAAALGLVTCWLALEARWFHAGVLGLIAVIWAMPGPVLGLGLKETIKPLVGLEDAWLGPSGPSVLRDALYFGPSMAPVVWASLLRFFPYAVAVLWPVVRLLPIELRDSARVDGASPGQELRWVVWPLNASACLRAALAVGVLSLGELAAGKLVETPGSQTFAHEVFNQMHYGVTNHLAGLCLVLLLLVGLGGAAVALVGRKRQVVG
jgi:iron(III) transport system permease protein